MPSVSGSIVLALAQLYYTIDNTEPVSEFIKDLSWNMLDSVTFDGAKIIKAETKWIAFVSSQIFNRGYGILANTSQIRLMFCYVREKILTPVNRRWKSTSKTFKLPWSVQKSFIGCGYLTIGKWVAFKNQQLLSLTWTNWQGNPVQSSIRPFTMARSGRREHKIMWQDFIPTILFQLRPMPGS